MGSSETAGPPPDAALDVFLLMGQSNMAGRGELASTKLPLPDTWMWRDGRLRVAAEPLHLDKGDRSGMGLTPAFVETLRAAAGTNTAPTPIAVIPGAWGGTPLRDSIPGGRLYTAVTAQLAALQDVYPNARVRGVLFHQGESDAENEEDALEYLTRFTAMVGQLRASLDRPALPVVLGELGTFIDAIRPRFPHVDAVRAAHRAAAARIKNVVLVSSAGLNHKGDNLHFDTASLHELGRRYAEAYLSLVAACTAADACEQRE